MLTTVLNGVIFQHDEGLNGETTITIGDGHTRKELRIQTDTLLAFAANILITEKVTQLANMSHYEFFGIQNPNPDHKDNSEN